MAQLLGWINVVFASFMLMIYPLKIMIRKNKKLIPIYRKARIIHPVTGIIILVVGLIHGYLMFGRIPLITSGFLIVAFLGLTALVAFFGKTIPSFKKHWRLVHRILGGVIVILIIAHVIYTPWFYQLIYG